MTRPAKTPRTRARATGASKRQKARAAPAARGFPVEAEQILRAIRGNEVDALVVRDGASENIFALRSIDELDKSEQARFALERRFDTLAANAPVGIFINDFGGDCVYINRRGCEIAGLTPETALGAGLFGAVHPDDQARLKREREKATAADAPFESEYRFLLPGGRVVWVARKSAPLMGEGGKSVARIGTIIDITERKLAEEALRESRQQLGKLLEERERLTQDLHDGCIQSLYAIGLNLQSSRQKLEGNPEAARVVASATANLNLVIQELRQFISTRSYGPRAKPDLTVEILRSGQASRDQGLAFDLDIEQGIADKLAAEAAQHLVQIAREAISNALRHAGAKSLHVRLHTVDGSVCLEIQDDGIGFNPKANEKSGLGLHHIEARARAVRGQARILSTSGKGTRVLVLVPASS